MQIRSLMKSDGSRRCPANRRGLVPRSPRRGVAIVWLLAVCPVLFAMMVLVADVAGLWLVELQLETAASAGALAGAKVWGESDDEGQARTAAQSFTNANEPSAPAAARRGGTADTPDRWQVTVELGERNGQPVCAVEVQQLVDSFWPGIAGPYRLRQRAVAVYDETTQQPTLLSTAHQ